MARRRKPPFALSLDRLELKGTSGVDDSGRRWTVRGAPVGAQLLVAPNRKQTARRLSLENAAPDAVTPDCPVFGTCGGCTLQEMPLAAQRSAKAEMVGRVVGHASRPARGAGPAYGYRNKVELSFGNHRYLPEEQKHDPNEGDWLGFHPPGWFSRIIPIDACSLVSPPMNRVIAAAHALQLGPAWDTREHTGHWRHLLVREGNRGVLAAWVTTSAADPNQVAQAAVALLAAGARSVIWIHNDGVAEVVRGETVGQWGEPPDLEISLRGTTLRIPWDGFFQVNREGAESLIDVVAEAVGTGGTLLDLYCGTGAIGLVLYRDFDEVVGVELSAQSIEQARVNAAELDVAGQWHAGAVEDVLPALELGAGPIRIVVDPPRAGLHPRAANYLAALQGEVLVYVACNPASLARDRVVLELGGWKLDELWTVDLFPQTNHVEAVARFVRD